MPRPILVPLDGSPFSEQAIPVALGIARRNRLRLELMLVHEAFIPSPAGPRDAPFVSPVLDSEWRSRHGAYMRDLVARYRKATTVPINGNVMDGAVAPGIAEHAATLNAKLIVLATHAGAPAGRLWLASIPRAVTHEAPAPVLLVKPVSERATPPSERFTRVVVPLDGSKVSESAIEYATMVAGKAGVEYTLLRVVTPVEEWELGAGSWGADEDLAISEANAYLAIHAKRLRAQGYRITTEVLRGARSADAILRYARNNAADLVAVTTHSRSITSRFFRRSVADRIARAPQMTALVARQLETVANPVATARSPRGRRQVAAV